MSIFVMAFSGQQQPFSNLIFDVGLQFVHQYDLLCGAEFILHPDYTCTDSSLHLE